jgi:hypothetical protein
MKAAIVTAAGWHALRSSALTLKGRGIGSIPQDRMVTAIGDLMLVAEPGGFKIATQTLPLCEVERVWADPVSGPRTVFQMSSRHLEDSHSH